MALGLVTLVLVVGAGLVAWVNSEFTWCYARFHEIRRAAPDAGVEVSRSGFAAFPAIRDAPSPPTPAASAGGPRRATGRAARRRT